MEILFGIASVNPDPRFVQDLHFFCSEVEKKHKIEVFWVKGKTLVEAQNEIAEYALSKSFDAVLFLEEDHWGHTPEMLEELIAMDTDVAAICYYSRWPAYPRTVQIKSGLPVPREYQSIPQTTGIHEADLCGFGFTLIKRRVFEGLDKPIFRLNGSDARNGGRNVATDKDFCERLKAAGFKIKGSLNHDFVHRGLSDKNIRNARQVWINRSRANRLGARPILQRSRPLGVSKAS